MKFLILLLSLVLIFSSGCGNSESNSTGNPNENDEATDDGFPNPTGGSRLTDDPSVPEIPGQSSNLCTKTCVTNAECGEKYNTCLKPKAGDPATTNTNVCTNSNGTPPKITLVVNEWDVPPGQNKLLCDFIEDETILYKFATVKKEACRNDMEARKAELAILSYNCGTPASMSAPARSTVTTTPPAPAAPARSTATTPPAPEAAAKATERDICAEPCGNTTQCRAKHKNCLRPKAGDPATTETTVCTKDGEKNITFELNEWNSFVGQTNTLLCDLIENGEVIRFATVQKNNCQLRLKERKAELTNESYTCQPQ